jgi:hypothetical protein
MPQQQASQELPPVDRVQFLESSAIAGKLQFFRVLIDGIFVGTMSKSCDGRWWICSNCGGIIVNVSGFDRESVQSNWWWCWRNS